MMTDIEKLRGELAIKSEFLSTRQCPDHSGKWERGRCLQCEIERLTAEVKRLRDYRGAIETYLGIDQIKRKELYDQLDAIDVRWSDRRVPIKEGTTRGNIKNQQPIKEGTTRGNIKNQQPGGRPSQPPPAPTSANSSQCSYWMMVGKGCTNYPYEEHWRECDICQECDPNRAEHCIDSSQEPCNCSGPIVRGVCFDCGASIDQN